MSATIRDLNRMSTPAGALRIGDNVPSSPQELMRALAIRRGTPLAVATRAV